MNDPQDLIDRRLMRCRCGHSVNRHVGRCRTRGWPQAATGPEPDVRCTRCECDHYSARPAPWRVRFRPISADDSALLVLTPWQVVSPSGRTTWSLPNRESAIGFARQMAALDATLARVQRLEGNVFGDHPSLRADPRPGTPSVDDIIAEARNGDVIAYEGGRRVLRQLAGLPEVKG